jgi:hypothetical protein
MKVKCCFCQNLDSGKCTAKSSGGKHPKVKPNRNRSCKQFKADPYKLAEEADKEYEKRKIPTYAPTWRYYASKKELKESKAKDGPKFVRLNPNV